MNEAELHSSNSQADVGNDVVTRLSLIEHIVNNDVNLSPDSILNEFGSKSSYLLSVICILSVTWFVSAMQVMSGSFIAGERCERAASGANESAFSNCSDRGTIASEFQLYGERNYLIEWETSVLIIGFIPGGALLPYLADRFGRRPVVILSSLTVGTVGCLTSMAANLYLLLVGRFMQGIFLPGEILVGWVLGYECTPKKLRSYATLLFGSMWVLGYCFLAPLAYILEDWRSVLFASSFPSLLAGIIFFFTVPESLHHCMANNKKNAAIKWLRRANNAGERKACDRVTKIVNHLRGMDRFKATPEINRAPLFVSFARNKKFAIYLAIVAYLWSTDTMVYYALSLHAGRLAGSKYWNHVLTGLAEIPAYALASFALPRLGRKKVIFSTSLLCGTLLIILTFVSEEMEWIITMLWLISKFSISCAFLALYAFACEIFPTPVRNFSIGFAVLISRFGGVVAPYFDLLGTIDSQLPTLLFGAIPVVASFLTLLLPETMNTLLPQSMDDFHSAEQH